jgi:hypothetical protein
VAWKKVRAGQELVDEPVDIGERADVDAFFVGEQGREAAAALEQDDTSVWTGGRTAVPHTVRPVLWGCPALTDRAGGSSGYLLDELLVGGGLELVGGRASPGSRPRPRLRGCAAAWLRVLLAELGLEPKEAKTRIVHLQVGGKAVTSSAFITGWYAMRRVGGKPVTYLARWPTNKAMQHARDGIRELTDRSRLWLHVGEIAGTSIGSCTAGLRPSSTATRPGTSTRSDTMRACGWRCLSANATAAAVRLAGGWWQSPPQPTGSGRPDRDRRRSQTLPGLAGEAECRR